MRNNTIDKCASKLENALYIGKTFNMTEAEPAPSQRTPAQGLVGIVYRDGHTPVGTNTRPHELLTPEDRKAKVAAAILAAAANDFD